MKAAVKPLYMPAPYQDTAESGRIILRDGSTATVRRARAEDQKALAAFFERLSPESRLRRFFSLASPSRSWLDGLLGPVDPRDSLTLLVIRADTGVERVIATASYQAVRPETAEVAFAVDDNMHGNGLGTLLLERLAVLAAGHGVRHFWAVTQADNQPMADVFRDSGFEIHERLDGGYLEIDLSVVPCAASVERSEMRDRIATAASLWPFFRPKSVAVVGASRQPLAIGYRVVDALVANRFRGPIYPVNPRAAEIRGLKAYASVANLPETVELAVIAVPRDAVLGVVDECAARGVRALVVITAGFAEAGKDGGELQKRLVEKVRAHGMRLVGPNCMGLLNTDPDVSLNASFSPVFPPAGKIAMSSQSGALGLAILSAARRYQLGLSTFVSVGNKADVSGNDLLQYWEEDPGTEVILLYLESFGNPRRFARIARRVSRKKPVVTVKAGRSTAGQRAAGSHTAALASSDIAVDALLHQAGVIRAETLEEMFDLAALLASQPLPRGRRTAVVTNAGGPGILCADACEAAGLTLPELCKDTRARLAAFLPAAAGLSNPIDMIASAGPDHYRQTVEAALRSEEIDSLIVIYIPTGLVETDAVAAAVLTAVTTARRTGAAGKPVLACLMGIEAAAAPLASGLERIPSFTFPEGAARALGKAAAYAEWRRQPQGNILDFTDADPASARAVCKEAIAGRGGGWLSARETQEVLRAMRLPAAPGAVAANADEAVEIARQVGFPVAVKLASQVLVHKTEIGALRLNLADETAVRGAFNELRSLLVARNQLELMEGVLVQPMLSGGVEVMVGVADDPSFGPLIAFGLGGIHVEILGDVCFRITPLTDLDAAEMVRSIRGYRLLKGYRGHPAADTDALEELLQRISRLIDEVPEIRELDLNPVFALAPGQGCRIVDARIRVAPLPQSVGN